MNLLCVVISTFIVKASANVDIFSKCPDFRPVNGFDIEEVSLFIHCQIPSIVIHFDLFFIPPSVQHYSGDFHGAKRFPLVTDIEMFIFQRSRF